MRGARVLLRIALGVALASAALPAQETRPDSARRSRPTRDTTNAVPIPARPDSIRPDTSRRRARGVPTDSAKTPRDTIKAPITRAEAPPLADVGPPYRWDRAALFASGALTLTDLLDRVPGLTSLRSGWINGPMSAAYLGDVGRVRVFYDGVALDPLDPRNGGSLDLSTIELWTLEEVAIERGADEVRVYLRSWRTRRTAPYTRTDIVTGDEDTNLYRGYYGKRFDPGESLQLAFQQYSTANQRFGGGGDQLSLLGRFGVARGRWSVDAFANRANRTRSARARYVGYGPLYGLQARYTNAYLRAGYGDPESGVWAQLTAASLGFRETSGRRAADMTSGIPADSADTTRSMGQYVAAAGFTRWGLRLSGTERLSAFQGKFYNAASARASFERRLLALSLFGERAFHDSTWRGEALARFRPLSFVAVAGAASAVRSDAATERPTSVSLRGEADLRLGGLWLGGGVLARDSALLRTPSVFDTGYVAVYEGRQTGSFATVRGRVYKALQADAYAVRWDKAGFYRPRDQARSELFIRTDWRSRFPSGNFGFLLSAMHEYRGTTFFPVLREGGDLAAQVAPPSRVLSFLLEIRIVSATVSVQLHNALGAQYQQVPGYEMPRPTSVYGVRWEFAN